MFVVDDVMCQVTPDVLFVLFGVYGDVVRIKIFFNKQVRVRCDTAACQAGGWWSLGCVSAARCGMLPFSWVCADAASHLSAMLVCRVF